MEWRRALVGLLALGAAACGRGGAGPPAPEPSDQGAAAPATTGQGDSKQAALTQPQVGLAPLLYTRPPGSFCLDPAPAAALPELPVDSWPVGAAGAAWQNLPALLSVPAAFDPGLGHSAVARAGDSLALITAFRPSGTRSLLIELGGLVAAAGSLQMEPRKLLRLSFIGLEEWRGGSWRRVSSEFGTVGGTSSQSELRLSRQLLDEVWVWPAWWIRLIVVEEKAERRTASSQAQYFASILNTDAPSFALSRCSLWASRRGDLSLLEIQPAASLSLNQAWAGVAAERAFARTRQAFDAVNALTQGVGLPLKTLPVIVVAAPFAAPQAAPDAIDQVLRAAGDQPLYRGLQLDLRVLAPDSVDPFGDAVIFAAAARSLLELHLTQLYPNAPPVLRDAAGLALLDPLIKAQMGMSYWLDYLPLGVAGLTVADDRADPQPLLALALGSRRDDRVFQQAKVQAFAHLLASILTPEQLLAGWRRAGELYRGSAPPAAAGDLLAAGLTTVAGLSDKQRTKLQALWHGWLDTSPYAADYLPSALGDSDGDGLPDFFERQMGTNPRLSDTDGDGWSDMAEVVLGTDPLSAASRPAVIVPDGDFSDWQRLMPAGLLVANPPAGPCPKAATINFFAALAGPDAMVIGAEASDFWANEPAARWELSLDFVKDGQQFLLTAGGASQLLTIAGQGASTLRQIRHKAVVVAKRTFEVAVSRSELGLKTPFTTDQAVRLRLRTLFTDKAGDHLCSESDWFTPIVSKG